MIRIEPADIVFKHAVCLSPRLNLYQKNEKYINVNIINNDFVINIKTYSNVYIIQIKL